MNLNSIWRNGFLTLATLCIFSLPSYADSLNLLVNGGFEDPIVARDSRCGPYANCLGFHNAVAGNDNIGGWQVIGKGGIDADGHPIPDAPATMLLLGYDYTEPIEGGTDLLHFHPHGGLQSVDLTGEGNQGTTNGIKQAVTTNVGDGYELSFWLGHQYSFAPGYVEGPGSIALYIDGDIIGSFGNFGNTTNDVNWTPFNYVFVASSSQTVVAFLNNTSLGNNYSGLDDVSLHSVPELSSLILLSAGILGLFALKLCFTPRGCL